MISIFGNLGWKLWYLKSTSVKETKSWTQINKACGECKLPKLSTSFGNNEALLVQSHPMSNFPTDLWLKINFPG